MSLKNLAKELENQVYNQAKQFYMDFKNGHWDELEEASYFDDIDFFNYIDIGENYEKKIKALLKKHSVDVLEAYSYVFSMLADEDECRPKPFSDGLSYTMLLQEFYFAIVRNNFENVHEILDLKEYLAKKGINI